LFFKREGRNVNINTNKHKIYKPQLSIIKNVSISQKTTNTIIDKAIILASTVLIYFISYFFLFIKENRMKIITLDYTIAFISLVPPMIFLAAIFIIHKSSSKSVKDSKKRP
jgi:hypothetical protein